MTNSYKPSKDTIKHVDAVLKLLKVIEDDPRYELKLSEMEDETEGGEAKMCTITEQWFNDGKEEGRVEERSNVAEEMIKDKMPLEQIQKFTKLSLEKLKAISKEVGVALVM